MDSNQVWKSLIEGLDLRQQDAVKSLQQNGCSFKDTKEAIMIFKTSKGHGTFCATDLMKIIQHQGDKEYDKHSDGEHESSKQEMTFKTDNENKGPHNIPTTKCAVCFKYTRQSSDTALCGGCKCSFVAKRKRYATI